LSAGDLTIAGVLEIRDGGTLQINSGRTVTNNGTVTLNPGGALLHSGVYSSFGTYTDNGTSTFGGTGLTRPWTATETTTGRIPNDGATYYLDGTVDIVDINPFNTYGPVEVRSGGTINITAVDDHAEFDLYDTLDIYDGGTINVNGTGSYSGNIYTKAAVAVTMHGGTITIGNEGYLEIMISSSSFTMNGGTLNFLSNGYLDTLSQQFTLNDGTINAEDGSWLTSYAQYANGYFNMNGGNFNLKNGAIFRNGRNATYTSYFVAKGGTFVWDGHFYNTSNASFNGNLEISDKATLVIGSNADLTKLGTNSFDVFGMTDFTVSGGSTTIPNGETLTIPQAAAYNVGPGSTLINLSSSSIDVDGDMYVYGTLTNGGATAGTVNVNYGGRLFVPGGTINSGHAGSAVNVHPGG